MMCGANVCGAGLVCCNASWGDLCGAGGGVHRNHSDRLLRMVGFRIDAPSVHERCPPGDPDAATPEAAQHFYRCVLTDPYPRLVCCARLGDLTNTYCCP